MFPGKRVSGQTFCIKNSACLSNNTRVALTVMVTGKISLWLNSELVFIKMVVSVQNEQNERGVAALQC